MNLVMTDQQIRDVVNRFIDDANPAEVKRLALQVFKRRRIGNGDHIENIRQVVKQVAREHSMDVGTVVGEVCVALRSRQ